MSMIVWDSSLNKERAGQELDILPSQLKNAWIPHFERTEEGKNQQFNVGKEGEESFVFQKWENADDLAQS